MQERGPKMPDWESSLLCSGKLPGDNSVSHKKEPSQRCSRWVHRGRGEVNS